MNYTFCKTCENEFDLDEIGDSNVCPHCDAEYEWTEPEEDPMKAYLAEDGDWN